MNEQRTSRLSGFYKQSIEERQAIIRDYLGLPPDTPLDVDGGLSLENADHMIENVIGTYNLPFAVGTNFRINERDYLIPMVVEEPSVVAAASHAAKLFRAGGGFTASSDAPVMIGQMQVLDLEDVEQAAQAVRSHEDALIAEANAQESSIVRYGGGAVGLELRPFAETSVGPMLIIHLLYDVRDAMGANTVNTAVEALAPRIEAITGGRVVLRILSNLADRRKARAEGVIPANQLTTEDLSGSDVVQAIVEAAVFAEVDPYRATTHNKGIMNGIDAVVVATGNDWRAIEAGAHAYAARSGRYTSLTRWWQDEQGDLRGAIELPLAVGTVGGATRVHPTAKLALQLLGVETAQELAEVMAAVGLAQNLAAIRALATTGIQHGHMRMHARQFAIAAGAPTEIVPDIVRQMIEDGQIRLEYARTLVEAWHAQQKGQT
jgi:hydroxymethylglutaryl-CoA reductase